MKTLSSLFITALISMVVGTYASAASVIDIAKPSMRVFLPAESEATGRAVVIFPGGGYSHTAINHEGYDWASFFNEHGIACAVVDYRMPGGDRTIPIGDAIAALKVMHDSASVWHIDPAWIGVMGSSAGGHLASTVATQAPEILRPRFQILFYPVITMDKAYTHRGSHDNLLGKDASRALEWEYSGERRVTPSTPQALIMLSADDKAVPPHNSTAYFDALTSAGVPVSLHIWPVGGHGWGHRETFRYHERMLTELSAWLENLK